MDCYVIPVALYVLFGIGFCFFSQEMDASDYRVGFWRLFQPFLLFILYIYLSRSVTAGLPAGLLACATGVITGFTFPVLFHLTHRGEPHAYSFPVDFTFGLFVSVLFVALADVLLFRNQAVFAVLLTVTEILFLLPAFFQLAYFIYYRRCVNEPAVLALLHTNRLEAGEYIRLIPSTILIPASAGFLLAAGVMFRINLAAGTVETYAGFPVAALITFLFIMILLFGIGRYAFFRRTAPAKICIQAKEHIKRMQDSPLSDRDYPSHITAESVLTKNKSDFGTVLLVIGESANRMHMRAFSDYERETTPWLSGQSGNKNFYLFPNSYATWIQTLETVTMALTNKNQYDRVQKEDEISVINLANKLGFKTYWFSAQGYSDTTSSDVTVIAGAAQHKHWLLQDYTVRQYDEKLLEYLKAVDTGNNFIVVHLEGSHSDFHLRYPTQFAKWSYDKKDPYGSNPYDNSILYTDHILSQLFAYAKEHLNLQAMIYFSDHGSLIGQQRQSSFTGFEDVRIPFFVYLSEAYAARFPDTARALRRHTASCFTNDLVFDLLCGIFQVTGALHKEKNDISSMSYGFTAETLKTGLGKVSLKEDLRH
jgi:heptose-I-phosphate ethanolaminephosphotransferase